jgi:hypothetical protein
LLVFLISIGIVGVSIAPGLLIALAGATVAGVLICVVGGLAGCLFALYVAISLSLTTPALMLEKQGIIPSLTRSRNLVRGSWWRVFGISLLAGIIASVISGIISAPFALAGPGLAIFSGSVGSAFDFTSLLVSGIGGLIGSTLVGPFSSGVVALIYLDRRMRAEGLDQTLQQAVATTAR